jgi:peptide/nickel transport system permease protein
MAVPTLLGVTLAIFVIMRVVPGDPAMVILGGGEGSTGGYTQFDLQRVREQIGLDRPVPVQYVDWLWHAIHLDFGTSLRYSSPVSDEIIHRFPLTLELTGLALAIGLAIGLPIGMISATNQNTNIDYTGRVLTSIGLAVPNFWAGTLMILFLSRLFGWVPPLGYVSIAEDPAGHLQQIIPPALVLGYGFAAYVARMSRAQVLEVLREDFVRTARAKGLRANTVLVRHALKNALLPVVTLSGLHVGVLLGGVVTIELIFSLPGLGRLLLDALTYRDYPLIQALVFLLAVEFLAVNLFVDLLYSWLDPRIRYA